MKKQLLLAVLCSVLAVSGCSKPEITAQVEKEDDFWEGFEEVVVEPEAVVEDAPTEIDLRLVIEPGQEQNYRLTNDFKTVSESPYDKNDINETTSFLYANQSVVVDEIENFYIHTTEVEGGVSGEGGTVSVADRYMKTTVANIEGSMLVAAYDEKASGKNLKLMNGSGLNPLGAQSGSQEDVMGFMGVLLPGGMAKPGDSWVGELDVSEIANEVFKDLRSRTSTGTIPLTYTLIGFDLERGLAQIDIHGSGSPVVDLPMGSSVAQIQMVVTIDGKALVRISDGWLYELRVQTDVVTDGFVATRHTVNTVIKAVSAPKESS